MGGGFGGDGAVFFLYGGFEDGEVAFSFHLFAGDEYGLADEDGLSEATFHFSRVGGCPFLEEKVVAHDFIHECHDESAMHAVVVALMLPLRREDGQAAVRGFEKMKVQPDGISHPAGEAHGVFRISFPFFYGDAKAGTFFCDDFDFFLCQVCFVIHDFVPPLDTL